MAIEAQRITEDVQLGRLLSPPYEAFRPGALSPATLLRPRYRRAAFVGRMEERRALMSWADRPDAGPRLLLCVGSAGQGKTRLAAEFAAELGEKGWGTGF